MWQDVVISIGQGLLLITPISILKDRVPIDKWASILTGVVLLSFTVALGSLGALMGATTSAIAGVLWLLIGLRR